MSPLPCPQPRTNYNPPWSSQSMSEPAEPLTDRAKWLRESREAISNGDKEELARHLKEKVRYVGSRSGLRLQLQGWGYSSSPVAVSCSWGILATLTLTLTLTVTLQHWHCNIDTDTDLTLTVTLTLTLTLTVTHTADTDTDGSVNVVRMSYGTYLNDYDRYTYMLTLTVSDDRKRL